MHEQEGLKEPMISSNIRALAVGVVLVVFMAGNASADDKRTWFDEMAAVDIMRFTPVLVFDSCPHRRADFESSGDNPLKDYIKSINSSAMLLASFANLRGAPKVEDAKVFSKYVDALKSADEASCQLATFWREVLGRNVSCPLLVDRYDALIGRYQSRIYNLVSLKVLSVRDARLVVIPLEHESLSKLLGNYCKTAAETDRPDDASKTDRSFDSGKTQ